MTLSKPTLSLLAILSGLVLRPAEAETTLQAQPYGCNNTQMELSLDLARGPDRLLVTGCEPGASVIALFNLEAVEVPLPSGITLLVRPDGQFGFTHADVQGIAEIELPAFEGAEPLYAQAFSRLSGNTSYVASGGLCLQWVDVPEGQPIDVPGIEMPPVLVDEIGRLLNARLLEEALALALNSTGDSVGIEIGGTLQVPIVVIPGLTAGGQISVKAQISRVLTIDGTVAYDISVGADAAALGGAGAGIAGATLSIGGGATSYWRLNSTAELVEALRCFAILQAIGTNLEIAAMAVDSHFSALEQSIEQARRVADEVRNAIRSRMPWRNLPVVQNVRAHLDAAREQRRALFDEATNLIEQLIGIVADAKRFLMDHWLGFEVRAATALEAKLGVGGIGNAKKGGEWSCANFGAAIGGSIRREFSTRLDQLLDTGRAQLTQKMLFTKTVGASAGCIVGAEFGGKRVLEIATVTMLDSEGICLEESDATVKLSLDARLMGALGFVVAGKFGVGGEISAEMSLKDLLDYSAEAAEMLLGDDDDVAARLLRSVPVTFKAQGRIEAELVVGIGMKIEGAFDFGIGGTANFTDRGEALEFHGLPSRQTLRDSLSPTSILDQVSGSYDEVESEVSEVMSSR